MPRTPRLDAPGTLHHVFNRGARKERVYFDDEGYIEFLALLAQLPARFGTRVHAYALMPNHFHLILEPGPAGLGPAMQLLQGGYSRWLNARRGWDGPVWRERFRSRLIDSDIYCAHLLAYLHLNPVNAGLADHVDSAEWTSHAAYLGSIPRPDWLTTDSLLEVHGGVDAYRGYVADVRAGVETGPDGFDPERVRRGRPRVAPPAVDAPEPSPSRQWPLQPESAWIALEAITGQPRSALTTRHHGPAGNVGWWLVLWWLPLATGQSTAAVAADFGLARSTASRAAAQLRKRAATDAHVARMVERLASLLPGG